MDIHPACNNLEQQRLFKQEAYLEQAMPALVQHVRSSHIMLGIRTADVAHIIMSCSEL